jgi:hypothetical protein
VNPSLGRKKKVKHELSKKERGRKKRERGKI